MGTIDYAREDILRVRSRDLSPEDDHLLTKLMYLVIQMNDSQMNHVRMAERILGRLGVYHTNVKKRAKDLLDEIHKSMNGKWWRDREQEQLDAVAMDADILDLLVGKMFGIHNKLVFFGGVDYSIGDKLWSVNKTTGKTVLLEIDDATAVVRCVRDRSHFGTITLHCTRINEKTAARTKDKYDLDTEEVFPNKESARYWWKTQMAEKRNQKH